MTESTRLVCSPDGQLDPAVKLRLGGDRVSGLNLNPGPVVHINDIATERRADLPPAVDV